MARDKPRRRYRYVIDVLIPANAVLDDLGQIPERMRLIPIDEGARPVPAEILVFGAEVGHLLPQLGDIDGLRLVQTLNAGVERLLPLVPAGVTVCNASGVHDGPVAEWIVAAIIMMERRLVRFVSAQRDGHWEEDGNALTTPAEDIDADDLDGKQVLVIGHGSIGRAVQARLAPFGATVIGVASHQRPGAHGPEQIHDLLPTADIVVLLTPLTDQTRGLVDSDFLSTMRNGALLVNAARGSIIDQSALEVELRSGRLRAALDVTDPEPLPDGHTLWSAPNILITPHVGGTSRRWKQRAYRFAGTQLRRYAAGEELLNVRSTY